MITLIIIALLVGIIWYVFNDRKSPKERQLLQEEQEKKAKFSFEYPQLQRIINESLEIINKTKNIETALTRFNTIKEMISRLLKIAPKSSNISIQIQRHDISQLDDLPHIDQAKEEWIRHYFREKINIEIKKAELLSDAKFKATQFKKALNINLKSFDYLPDDPEFRQLLLNIEDRIMNINGQPSKKLKLYTENNLEYIQRSGSSAPQEALKEWAVLFKKAIKDGQITQEELKELNDFEKQKGIKYDETMDHWEKATKLGITIESKIKKF